MSLKYLVLEKFHLIHLDCTASTTAENNFDHAIARNLLIYLDKNYAFKSLRLGTFVNLALDIFLQGDLFQHYFVGTGLL